MKIISIGDLHGRQSWKYIVNSQSWDLVVFLGDYLDSFEFSGEEQANNLLDIIEFKKNNSEKVVLLIGNRDHPYFPEVGYTGTSGYQPNMAPQFEYILDSNRNLFQMAYKHEEILFTHAGFAPTWMETLVKKGDIPPIEWDTDGVDHNINEVWRYKPLSFCFRSFNGRSDRYGDNVWQSPIWIRPKSLMADCQDIKKDIIQVCGHTQQNQIDIKGKATGGRYYFIDTLGTSGEYLIIENNEFKTGKV